MSGIGLAWIVVACTGGGDGKTAATGSTWQATTSATTGSTGTSTATGGTTATTPPPYHPEGFADPAVHGLEAKLQQQDCTACHGADLSGGEVSCDDCHAEGWRTDCTYCHGGVDNATGAPPEDIDDQADAALTSFPPHTEHVAGEDHPAYGCTECHVMPVDILTPGHLFVDDATPAVAETVFAGGLSPDGAWDGASCTNLYCHGDGQGPNGAIDLSAGSLGCGACHPPPSASAGEMFSMSGEHHEHSASRGVLCSECHGAVLDSSQAVVGDDLHVDGKPDVLLPKGISWDPKSRTCTGDCHEVRHPGRSW